jgi:two-component system chemotaxis sensor kinase CheA
VLDGMVVTVAGQTLVLPLTTVIETLQPTAATVHGFGSASSVISVRNAFTPLIDVAQRLGYRPESADPLSCVAILVESEDSRRSALLVDAIQDQRQIVVKSLEGNYGNVPGIAAATILGDGRVALILDVDAVVAGAGAKHSSLKPSLAAVG